MFAVACLVGPATEATHAAAPPGEQSVPAGNTASEPDEATRAWIQASLDNWETICRRDLRIELEPLPWIVFYDEKQSWHLSPDEKLLPPHEKVATTFLFDGRPRTLRRMPHDNAALWTPGGAVAIGPGKAPQTFSMPYDHGTKAFFVLAAPSVVRTLAGDGFQNPEVHLLEVASHELAHTRQLADVMRRITTLRQSHNVPIGIDDNFIQKTYGGDPDYARVFADEGTLFYRAAVEAADPDASRRLLREALSLVERRRARFFTGASAVHAEIEDIFLVMEGVGEWVRFRTKRRQASPASAWQETLNEMMASSSDWVQQQGLVLFVLLDRLVPGWQARFLSPAFPSPFAVLRGAL